MAYVVSLQPPHLCILDPPSTFHLNFHPRCPKSQPFGCSILVGSHAKSHLPHRLLNLAQKSGASPLSFARCQNGSLSADNRGFERPIRTLLIDNYDSYTYNLYQLLFVINGVAPVVVKNDEIPWEDLRRWLYEEGAFDNIVISPGPGSPTCPKDIGICMQVLKQCADIPLLGVCMGHQALGYASGARVVHAPEPVHGRVSEIEHVECPLFKNIPSGQGSGFRVVRYHSLMLDTESFPEDLIPTAWTVDSYSSVSSASTACIESKHPLAVCSSDSTVLDNICCPPEFSTAKKGDCLENSKNGCSGVPCSMQYDGPISTFSGELASPDFSPALENQSVMSANGISHGRSLLDKNGRVVMAVSHMTRPHYGVQFHPESVATTFGKQILENFRDLTVEFWQSISFQKYAKDLCSVSSGSLVRDHTLQVNSNNSKYTSRMGLKSGFLRLCWEKVDRLAKRAGGSKGIFCGLFGDGSAQDTFWLDSSSQEHGGARFSFMGGKGGPLWKRITYQMSDKKCCPGQGNQGILKIENSNGFTEEIQLKEGFLEFLSRELQSCSTLKEDCQGLPFDFCGGFLGYLGYELKEECGVRFNRHKSHLPDACYFFADQFIAVDHSNDDVYLLVLYEEIADVTGTVKCEGSIENSSNSLTNGLAFRQNMETSHVEFSADAALMHEPCSTQIIPHGRRAAQAWVKKTLVKISALVDSGINIAAERRYSSQYASSSLKNSASENQFIPSKCRKQYIQDVRDCLGYIRDGESYELCLTTQLKKRLGSSDALGLYLTLREMNPAPYAAWLNFGREEVCICCSSPERFLRLDQAGILEAKPIKGTIRRGNSLKEDEALKYKLQNSEKDRAENLMIVDLLRNDLGRVCKPGSVYVPSLMAVESYATVHTLVSTVRGAKRLDVTPVDCVRAAFPGGSMTGAPKLRAMELLDSLECGPRGVYSGTLGFFSVNSSFDLNIVIRTLVIHNGIASIGAGGAIVSLSDPEDEFEEMLLKARALIRAVTQVESKTNMSSWDVGNGVDLPRTSELHQL